ncbi:MAG TPA: hypothetical protein DC049_14525 [Spirochaetia bacterium]|nr:hypothetical protein [Spirochaetia bacterium]
MTEFLRFIVLGGALACPFIPLYFYFTGNWYAFFHPYSLGAVFGLFSYVYFLNTLIIAGRIKFFDRLFGHDRVMVFHSYLAMTAMFSALVHLLLKQFYFQTEAISVLPGIWGLLIFFTVAAITMLFMSGPGQNLRFFSALRSFAADRLKIDYNHFKLFHNLVSAAAVLIALHALAASSTREKNSRTLILGIWAIAALSIYLYHKLFKPAFLLKKLVIQSVTMLTDDLLQIRFEKSRDRLIDRSGQFGFFRILSPVCGREEHPFTVASSPDEPVSLLIKKNGDYTGKLHGLQPGTEVLFDGPYGRFFAEKKSGCCLGIAGGAGISPFISFFSERKNTGFPHPFIFIWCVKRQEDLFCLDFLGELKIKTE